MHGMSSFASSAFVAPLRSASSSSRSTRSNNHDSYYAKDSACMTHDGTRFSPQPLAMMMGGVGFDDMEALGFAKDVLTAAATGATGDIIAQLAEHKRKQDTVVDRLEESLLNGEFAYQQEIMAEQQLQVQQQQQPPFELDVRRSLSYATFAAGYTGGFQHFLFANLQETIPDPVERLAINQGLIIPLCYYSLLVLLVPKLRARSPQEEDQLRSNIDVMKMIPRNWAFWVPLQFVQFNFIPTDFQVVYCSFLGLIWNICLSLLTAGTSKAEEPATTSLAPAAYEAVDNNNNNNGLVADVKISMPSASWSTPDNGELVEAYETADQGTMASRRSLALREQQGSRLQQIFNGAQNATAVAVDLDLLRR